MVSYLLLLEFLDIFLEFLFFLIIVGHLVLIVIVIVIVIVIMIVTDIIDDSSYCLPFDTGIWGHSSHDSILLDIIPIDILILEMICVCTSFGIYGHTIHFVVLDALRSEFSAAVPAFELVLE